MRETSPPQGQKRKAAHVKGSDRVPHFIIDTMSGTPRNAVWRIKLDREFLAGEYETAEQALAGVQ
jgi:hypothetical protein